MKYKEDFAYRLAQIVRRSVSRCLSALRVGNSPPSDKKRTNEYLGCSFPDLKAHLEKDDFHGNPGMSWENYGSLWHVDHIVPIQYRGADGQKPDAQTQVARLHFSNLQPMWSEENLRKGNRFVGRPPPLVPFPVQALSAKLGSCGQQNRRKSFEFRNPQRRCLHSLACSRIPWKVNEKSHLQQRA
eukprot:Cvel_27181.t1-p1 / transcript=Cvel_27181.t1 / gene=Cvel_27181 / organism=Chromera_velia_CCMP2878 / gene_product=Uncharacterized protein L426, putative / transcript_product=Uncharacterized protein L426, putative / location=Cvel_scaffold3353:1900-2452(-) / protein_length=184 / sequence_SO=supercontig / SO=protein_coding / is_pseudo=false